LIKAVTFSALLAALFLSCGGPGRGTQTRPAGFSPDRFNIILISIDTLRGDRLGCYGYPRPTSPAVDALASRGVRFERVIAEASWTLPSHMTLFTGLYPTTHGVTDRTDTLRAGVPTLAQGLRSSGYRTFGYCGGRNVDHWFGFGRGFERYEDTMPDLETTLEEARRIIPLFGSQPYFLFLHTYDVHCPYDPPAEYAEAFRTRPPEDRIEVAGRCGNPDFNAMSLTPGQARFLSDQYDAGIRAADDLLGSFFAFLDQRKELDHTILVFLSDHGEEFMEHGRIGHEKTLYIESLRVPLIIVAPGLEPRVVMGTAGLVDVLPTLLDMVGVEGWRVQGHSLLPRMLGREPPPDPDLRFSELDRSVALRSLVLGDRQVIEDSAEGTYQMYDFATDLREQNDLADSGEVPEPLRDLMSEHFQSLERPEKPPAAEPPDHLVKQLRTLGYIN
jgi:arylsulfatase A-like enzyme